MGGGGYALLAAAHAGAAAACFIDPTAVGNFFFGGEGASFLTHTCTLDTCVLLHSILPLQPTNAPSHPCATGCCLAGMARTLARTISWLAS